MDKWTIVSCKVGKTTEVKQINANNDGIQTEVDGYYELYPVLIDGVTILCNEDAALTDKPINDHRPFRIYGDFIFIGLNKSEFKSLNGKQILEIIDYLGEYIKAPTM